MLIQAADLGSNSKVVAEKASFCLKYVLLPRNPKLFYQYFTGEFHNNILLLHLWGLNIDDLLQKL